MTVEAAAPSPGARLGASLVLLSAVAWSLAGPLTKGVDADVWAVLAWRGLFSGIAIVGYTAWRSGDALWDLCRMGWPGWAATTIGSVATVAYIGAFKLTSVAHVAVIYGTAPFLAAGVAWWWLREPTTGRVALASTAALVGVAVMVGGASGAASLTGDGLAVLMTFGMAVMMVIIRRYPAAPMVLAAGVSSAQLLVIGWLAGSGPGGFGIGATDPLALPGDEIAVLAAFGVLHAAAAVLLTEGTRLIPAPEAALLGAMEVPMAPLWALLLLGEAMPPATLLGGGVVIAALFWYLGRRKS